MSRPVTVTADMRHDIMEGNVIQEVACGSSQSGYHSTIHDGIILLPSIPA